MRISKFFRIAPFLFVLGGTVLAQQPGATPVAPVTMPADRMQWKVKIHSAPEKSATAPANPTVKRSVPSEIGLARSGEITHAVVSYEDGKRLEFWQVGQYDMGHTTESNRILILKNDPAQPPYPYAPDKYFYGLEHVRPGDEQQPVEFEKTKCRYYRGSLAGNSSPAKSGGPAQPISAASTYEAWFDLVTGLPKAYREDNMTLIYEFSDPLAADLQLPADLQAAWNKQLLLLRAAGLNRRSAKR